ncbi:MAG: 16S rRNA (cytosine(1402)-N(4))-methyltransferase RsmH, partial [Nitratireductor sp.]|nr:16S rRNA (cytosine(1402)-N(4))-methyltransferase RsmH [Nitratireductor sp.]
MTDRGGLSGESAAGGPVRHVPVMLHEVLAALAPRPGASIVDGTFGAGGYSEAILQAGANVLAIDRDPAAIAGGQEMATRWGSRLQLVRGEFAQLDTIAREAGMGEADGVVLDIGVSSMQLDEAERGFSFRKDGPLDMRMSGEGPSAADVVNRAGQKDLLRIIGILGEEKNAPRVARAIAERREVQPFERTLDLAGVVEKAVGRSHGDRIHPATRTFQGLRIFVNRELEQLAAALSAAERLLKEGGRLVVVT